MLLPISFILTDIKRNQKGSAMEKIIGVVLVGMCVLLVGCGQSSQEKAVEQQPKKEKVVGDGHEYKNLKPGESLGGL